MKKAEPGDRQLLADESADIVARSLAADRLATDGDVSVEPFAAKWLTHEKGQVRSTALYALVAYLRLDRYVDAALQMLREDPDDEVRMEAATALGFRALEDPSRAGAITAALAKAALHDESELVTDAARSALDDLLTRAGASVRDANGEKFGTALLKKLAGEE